MTHSNITNIKLLIEKNVINVSVPVTEDVGHGIAVPGAPEETVFWTWWIGCQRTVQGPATPAHKKWPQLHADKTQCDVQIHINFLI